MSEIRHITENEFEDTINENKLVLIDFYAQWCPPCKMLAPILEEVQKAMQDVLIVKIDVDQNEAISRKFKIMSIPNMILFKDGEMVESVVGLKDQTYIMEMIRKHMN